MTHLDFYQAHRIAPVSYDMSDMEAHLKRRESLYLHLKLPPIAFRGAKVLEVAAGLGHNSLYVAHMRPSKLVLLEPNPTAVEGIHHAFATFDKKHTFPEVVAEKLEEYISQDPFDIVLCENWLGTSKHERSLLHKLLNLCSSSGHLVITTISPIGFVPNLLRRFLARFIAPISLDFQTRTSRLLKAFSPHLKTVQSMTRSHKDWVQDNLLNPAYFGIALSLPKVIEEIGGRCYVIGTSPSFIEDWRWFKSLYRDSQKWNELALLQYRIKAHNFLDYREPPTTGDPLVNQALEEKAEALIEAVHKDEINPSFQNVLTLLQEFLSLLPPHLPAFAALQEVEVAVGELMKGKPLPPMQKFSPLFGRETLYLSLKTYS